jgi:hypothetical protein
VNDDRDPLSTIEYLRRFEMFDGGCLLWSVLYDVRRGTFEGFECDGLTDPSLWLRAHL